MNAAAAIIPESQRWNMRFLLKLAFGSLALGCLIAWTVNGGDGSGCCPHCGCNNLVPVCKQVPVVTKVPKVEYSCKCGDICVPGRSIYCGKECVTDCDGCTHHEKIFQPTCGHIYKTVTPEKKTTMVEKCSYKCVVEYVCGKCGCNCGGGGYSAQSYAPAGSVQPQVHPHVEPHPLHTQSN
jgi:hypothetical protein